MSLLIPDNVLCIIPARAGSQGIIRKNIQPLGGIPLVAHSIHQALISGIKPSKIVVSTDSEEVLDIACDEYRVIALQRPPALAGPKISTELVLLDAIKQLRIKDEHILLLQPTSPFRLKGTINQFVEFYLHEGYDSALTATKFYNFFWRIEGDEFTSTYDPFNRPMRQDLTPFDYRYFDNGNMYLTKREVLERTKCRLGGKVGVFSVSELEGLQIDTPQDLEIAQAIADGSVLERC